jgi:hypothetical protein
MHLSKGEFSLFSSKGKLNLISEFGILITINYIDDVKIMVYQLYDFYVEVIYCNRNIIKIEPLMFKNKISFYY